MTGAGPAGGGGRRSAMLLFLLLVLVAAALHPGVVDNVDSRIVLRTAEQLIDTGSWSLGDVAWTYMASPEYGAIGCDGTPHMKFGAGNALLDIPFVLLGRTVLAPCGLDVRRAGEAGAAFSSCLWFGLSGVLVLRIARRWMPERAAVGAALLHCLAGYALVYGRSAYLETPLTVFVLLAWDSALAARAAPDRSAPAWALGVAAVGVLWIKHAAVLLLAGVPFVLITPPSGSWKAAVRIAARAAIPGSIGAAAWMALNAHRFGSPFDTGYAASARFDNPVFDGVLRLIASERGGWLYFAPAALLGLAALPAWRREDPGYAAGVAVACALSFPLYATFFSPYGGDAWGPRYLLPNAALLAPPAAWLLGRGLASGGVRRALAAAVVAWGVALQAAPCVTGFPPVWTAIRAGGAAERPGPLAAVLATSDRTGGRPVDLGRFGGQPAWTSSESNLGSDWWVMRVARELPRFEVPARFLQAALIGGAVVAAFRLRRRLAVSA